MIVCVSVLNITSNMRAQPYQVAKVKTFNMIMVINSFMAGLQIRVFQLAGNGNCKIEFEALHMLN